MDDMMCNQLTEAINDLADAVREHGQHSDKTATVQELEGTIAHLMSKMQSIRESIEQIVCTEGDDAGVVMLSHYAPTHQELGVTIYDMEYCSPLGDALVKLHRMTEVG